ncbi:glycine-rich domain-containing protein [Phenylobacterium sp.]|uniref:glycine-rich domain-containing protein n=1 Tax=Phenylobacterium sp. TaxID=1871053 RepID=UPI0025ED41E0|nr:hypothetical protein [Phenylobacterium sp.]
MSSIIKVNNIKDTGDNNMVVKCGSTLTLGKSGDTVAIASGASTSGMGRTGTVDWDTTPKTTTFTAVSGDGFFCNTTDGAFTCNLPAGSAGAIVSLADYAATWNSNALTVSPNGSEKIGGVNADVALTTQGQSVTFIYVDSTQGWLNVQDSTSNERGSSDLAATGGTITTSGDFKIHTFTGPGTFTVTNVSSTPANNIVSYLVVGGGGGGGHDDAGGGGAGGFRELKSPSTPYTASPLDGYPSSPNRVTVTAQAYPITVGAGGNGAIPGSNNCACGGSPSTGLGIVSAGGGEGNRPPGSAGGAGGSGGGGAPGAGAGGAGNTPPTTPPQGQPGGAGTPLSNEGGGGGGAGAAGGAGSGGAPSGTAGPGGAGVATLINPATGAPGPGPSQYYSGGGGGGAFGTRGSGGVGGGGAGGQYPSTQAEAGTANTGGGGGAGSSNTGPRDGKNGGSGIVIIRYKFQN